MTQTTPSHSQAVEAAVQRLFELASKYRHVAWQDAGWHEEKLLKALREELTSQQEVVAPANARLLKIATWQERLSGFVGDDDVQAAMQEEIDALRDERGALFAMVQRSAASRVPVASLAEPATYDKQEIDLLVHRITGQDTAEDSIDALQNAARILDDKTIRDVVDELYDATQEKQDQGVEAVGAVLGDTLEDNVRYLLEKCPYTVRDHSGDRTGSRAKEDLAGSLAITFLGMQSELKKLKESAPVPVVQGEAIDKAHLPDLRYIRMFLLGLSDEKHRSGDLSAAINGINYIIKRTESATPANMAVGAVGARRTPAEIVALKERGDMEAFLRGLTKTRGYICLREFIRQMQENGTACDDEGEDTDALAELADAIALDTPAPEQATTGSGQGVTDAERLDWLDQNIFHREITDDWDKRLYPDRSMWVTFAPKGHQGSARNIIDAAILSTASPAGEGEVTK